MCGILGVASTLEINTLDFLNESRDLLSHRGPDGFGTWWSNDFRVGLAHRRLSILDLSEHSAQPMCSMKCNACVTFNGEIYNYLEVKDALTNLGHTFQTTSDTEVILFAYKEWGVHCVERFIGMFAIALFDISRQELYLLRDRAGEKPLFYCITDGQIYFSSEIKALLSFPQIDKCLDFSSLDYLLSYGYTSSDQSIVQGIKKVLPGTYLKFELNTGKIEIKSFWDFSEKVYVGGTKTQIQLIDELDYLISSSVEMQLNADVEVGVLLSGGLDSSLIAALASKNNKKVKTFNVSFPDFPDFNESKHAKLIANHFKTDHYELEASSIEPEILDTIAVQFDDPIIDSSMIPTYLVSKMVKEHCTVALGGDGGDELFGGYKTYSNLILTNEKISRIPTWIRNSIFNTLNPFISDERKWKYWINKLKEGGEFFYPTFPHFFSGSEKRELCPELKSFDSSSRKLRMSQIPKGESIEEIAMRFDFSNYMCNDVLVKVDRASMLSSLELRAPLLDYRIIDFAFTQVHSKLKVDSFSRKMILKEVARRHLPESFDYERKKGFSVPIDKWMKKDSKWIDYSYEVLNNSQNLVFNKKEVNKMLFSKVNNGEKIFGLLVIQLFQNKYNLK